MLGIQWPTAHKLGRLLYELIELRSHQQGEPSARIALQKLAKDCKTMLPGLLADPDAKPKWVDE